MYRAWEIAVISLKWVLVDRGPLHDHRRSFLGFVINLFELAAAYTIAALPPSFLAAGQQWHAAIGNVGSAITLEVPTTLRAPYGTLFTVESAFVVLVVFACVVGGIQRGAMSGDEGAA